MPSAFQKALSQLDATETGQVQIVFTAWTGDPTLSQVEANIAAETALPDLVFASLLRAFAAALGSGSSSPPVCWQNACRAHKLQGAQVPVDRCPAVLGRAKRLDRHARDVADASGGRLAPSVAERMLFNQRGKTNLTGLEPFLRAAPLGRYDFVWATFDEAHPDADPFARLPDTRAEVRAALGLGGLPADKSLILLCWGHIASGSPTLRRPTVADAEDYPFYRPHHDATALWGWTQPLPPNTADLPPQPEVVLRDPTSIGLRLPFRIV